MKRALRSLIRLFPGPFREQFGAEISDEIDRDYDAALARGLAAAIVTSLGIALDLLLSAAAERWHPAWPYMAAVPTPRKPMRPTLREWTTDLRLAIRALARVPGFTVVVVGTLGLAIGANAAMFAVIDGVLLRPLPYAEPDRLVHIAASAPGSRMPSEFAPTHEYYVQYRELSRRIEDVARYNSSTGTLRTEDRLERIRMTHATSSLFSTLGAKPILGRLPVAADESNAMVISHELWMSWFGGDTAVLGRRYAVGTCAARSSV